MADGDADGVTVLLAFLVAAVAAGGVSSSADATPTATANLSGRVGESISMSQVLVRSVPADEGFWVDSDTGRVWVQIDTPRESPYSVDRGDRVSFTGRVVPHRADFPASVGVTRAEGAQDLAGQAAHVVVAENALAVSG